MRNHPQNTVIPSFTSLASIRVSKRIDDAVHRPHGTQHRRRHRVLESGNEHGAQSRGVVLVEVLVRALRRVEGDHGF